MTLLEEVPGALERPGGCRIVVAEEGDGTTTVTIPPRTATPVVLVASAVLLINLLLALYVGGMLFFAHRSVLFMTQVVPRDLPRPLWPYALWLGLVTLGLEFLGFWALAAMLRPLYQRETLIISRDEVAYARHLWGRTEVHRFPRENVRGFHLKRDPNGFSPSVLTLQARGERIVVGEQADEADREWLTSVCQVLLRR